MAREFRFCSECGESLRSGAAFCGACGASVPRGDCADGRETDGPENVGATDGEPASSGSESSAAPRRRRRSGLAVALVLLVLVAAGLAYIGYGSLLSSESGETENRGSVPEATEETTARPDSGGETTGETSVADPEPTGEELESPPEAPPEPQSVEEPPVAYTSPDPAFNFILPDLVADTSGKIMLPADLPGSLKNVAIEGEGPADPATKIPEWSVVFTTYEQETTFDQPAEYQRLGAIRSAPAPAGYEYTVPDGYEATVLETLALSDGTEATLAYVGPAEGVVSNDADHWEGGFLRDSTLFTFDIYDTRVSEEEARAFVSSMVEVVNDEYSGETAPQTDTATPSQEEMSSGDALDAFVNDYWVAVGNRDWATTYSYLSSQSQAEFTEQEWVAALGARETEVPTCNGSGVSSAEIADGYAAGEGGVVDVAIYCADESTAMASDSLFSVDVVDGSNEYGWVLTEEEIEILRAYL